MKSDYTEGNAFQWSFFAPHDMDNFIKTIGGKPELEARLDTLFTTCRRSDGAEASNDITGPDWTVCPCGNEPSHHMAYLCKLDYRLAVRAVSRRADFRL